MKIESPYLLFLGDAPDQLAAKTARGVAHWCPDRCLGQLRLAGCQADLGLPDLTLEAAKAQGAKTLIIGVANRGGTFAQTWVTVFARALDLGYDIASGLHHRLGAVPILAEKAAAQARNLFDVRHPKHDFPVATGERRSGKRLLAVGTDCSVGKMYATLALAQAMKARGLKADFRATGQTGIFIVGAGVSIDAVVADFISGAVEWLTPANDADHWDVVEGQGSLHHPSFAGVTTGLIHGAQPDALVLCSEPDRPHMRGLKNYKLPTLTDAMMRNLDCARLTNPAAKFVGICLNTANMDAAEAERVLKNTADQFGLPAVDPVRTGVDAIVDQLA